MVKEYIEKLILIIGTNGTGKTTLESKFVIHFLQKNHKVLIATPDMFEWKKIPLISGNFPDKIADVNGAGRLIITHSNAKEMLTYIYENFSNGLLIFDDCRAFLKSKTDEFLEALFIRRRQKKINIIAVAHNFDKMPAAFWSYANEIFLFKTVGGLKNRKEYVNNADIIEQAQQRINQKAEKNIHYYEIIKL